MRKWVLLFTAVFLFGHESAAKANEADILKEIEQLKLRIAQLEEKLKERPAEETTWQEESESEKGAKDVLEEKLGTLSIHGGVVGYYQGASKSKIGGTHFGNPDGAGFAADLEFSFEPIENGEFFLRLHAGEGDGADRQLEEAGALFADLNTINDDNPGDGGFDLLECFYTHRFLDERFFFSIGKTEPVVFIDDNAFANDEVGQFVGKPFVNDPVLDSEDEFGPLAAFGFWPSDCFSLVALIQSSSHSLAAQDQQKDVWDDIFEKPLFAGQLTYSPAFQKLQGTYRLYGWVQTYDHPEVTGNGTDEGWGLGLSCDQQISEKVGLFGRFGYHNDEVYEVPWFYSLGTAITGLIPSREEDEIGFGFAGLKANDDLPDDGTEFHLEGYYKSVLSEYLALTLDLQYVVNPLGDSSNDDVFAGMVRGEFSF